MNTKSNAEQRNVSGNGRHDGSEKEKRQRWATINQKQRTRDIKCKTMRARIKSKPETVEADSSTHQRGPVESTRWNERSRTKTCNFETTNATISTNSTPYESTWQITSTYMLEWVGKSDAPPEKATIIVNRPWVSHSRGTIFVRSRSVPLFLAVGPFCVESPYIPTCHWDIWTFNTRPTQKPVAIHKSTTRPTSPL